MAFEILGVDVYHILSWFIVYSFFGWVWESCYVSAKNGKWVNRGFVSGPFVTLYGVGAVLVYVILRPLAGHPVELYFAGTAVTTALEYVTGVLMEAIFHTNWWDYSKKKFNFQGKICLGSSIAWGFFCVDPVLFAPSGSGETGRSGSAEAGNSSGVSVAGLLCGGFFFFCGCRFRSEGQTSEVGWSLGRISRVFSGNQTA